MKDRPRILIVDDEPNIRKILQVAFEKVGYQATVSEDAPCALREVEGSTFDVILSDVTMPGMNGYEFYRTLRERKVESPIVFMTAFGTIPQAIQAIRDGAHEYITKPFDLDHLKKVIASALEAPKPIAKRSKKGITEQASFIAESPAMRQALETVQQVADSRATVLIGGESGTGKEVIAKALHTFSSRAKAPFVAVSCAALPESLLESELFGYEKGAFTGAQNGRAGRFELADGGTLFLDEIGELPMSVQVKLLRVLQERQFERLGSNAPVKVDVRLVTATNRDLAQEVEKGTFRLDLLYRLQVVEIALAPLRDRVQDIIPLANHFLAKFALENGRVPLTIGDDAATVLQSYRWTGNVRELENTMERATVLAAATESRLNLRLLPTPMLRVA